VKKDLGKELTFRKLGLMQEIVTVLEDELKIGTPSPIQSMAIPHLLKGKSSLLAAQTGTGKTLAYSLPIIHRLKQDELGAETQLTLPNRPRALVLVPSRELV